MKNLTLFYLEGCPYCRHARKAMDELKAENPVYGSIGVQWINESKEAALAGRYDYYYVPAVFLEKDKLFEASPAMGYEEIKLGMRQALDTALTR